MTKGALTSIFTIFADEGYDGTYALDADGGFASTPLGAEDGRVIVGYATREEAEAAAKVLAAGDRHLGPLFIVEVRCSAKDSAGEAADRLADGSSSNDSTTKPIAPAAVPQQTATGEGENG